MCMYSLEHKEEERGVTLPIEQKVCAYFFQVTILDGLSVIYSKKPLHIADEFMRGLSSFTFHFVGLLYNSIRI